MTRDDVLNLGYTEEDLTKIKNTYFVCNYKDDVLYYKIVNVYSFFLKMKYSQDDIMIITRSCLEILGYDCEVLRERIIDLKLFGFNFNEIKKMIKDNSKILTLNGKSIERKIKSLVNLGFSHEETLKMIKNVSRILNFSSENIKQKIDSMQEIGYVYQDVKKMCKNCPGILCYNIDYLKQKINNIENLGFSHEEIIGMSVKFPSLLGYSIDNIKKKIDDMVDLGYSRETVLGMIKALPSLLGLSIDTIREKKEFYDSIGLSEIMTLKTTMIMQGVELSYARYMFYKSMGIEITMDNYLKLFTLQERFKKKYGFSNKELISMFDRKTDVKRRTK